LIGLSTLHTVSSFKNLVHFPFSIDLASSIHLGQRISSTFPLTGSLVIYEPHPEGANKPVLSQRLATELGQSTYGIQSPSVVVTSVHTCFKHLPLANFSSTVSVLPFGTSLNSFQRVPLGHLQ
jgi:hypothetical protein